MPQTAEISTDDRETYTLFIRFLRSPMPQLQDRFLSEIP